MAVFAHRLERKYLRLDLALEFDHQTHHAGLVAPRADQLDVGVGLDNLGRQRLQHLVELDAFEVDHQPLRILDQHLCVADGLIVLQRDAGVVARRPDAHGQHAGHRRGASADSGDQQGQAGGGVLEDFTPARHVRPLALAAEIRATRPSPAVPGGTRNSIWISAAGRKGAAFSGHSTRQIPPAEKYSSSPASRYSSALIESIEIKVIEV
jgi:hypothetical protein